MNDEDHGPYGCKVLINGPAITTVEFFLNIQDREDLSLTIVDVHYVIFY